MTPTDAALRRTIAVAIALASLASCSRITGLPAVPEGLTRAQAGLDALPRFTDEARELARPLAADERARFAAQPPTSGVDRARLALERIRGGDASAGVRMLAELVESNPGDLVFGNVFRMQVYRLKQEFLVSGRARGDRSAAFPDPLRSEPLATLERAQAAGPTKELGVQIGLAYVDRMMLDPALEIRAPASIDSVHAFDAVLARDPFNVPALVGRGLNHLNRPRRLVWPEHPAPPEDAASRDLSLAAAVGSKVGGASARVKGVLLLLLGDAYAHEGKAGLARSWWTLAGEATGDRRVHDELRARAAWPEPEFPDRLEARLEERMTDTDAPVSDLSFLWDDDARGPW